MPDTYGQLVRRIDYATGSHFTEGDAGYLTSVARQTDLAQGRVSDITPTAHSLPPSSHLAN
jgi:hypothetical protein